MRYSEPFSHVHADVRDPNDAEPIDGVVGIGWTAQQGWQALAELAELAEVSGRTRRILHGRAARRLARGGWIEDTDDACIGYCSADAWGTDVPVCWSVHVCRDAGCLPDSYVQANAPVSVPDVPLDWLDGDLAECAARAICWTDGAYGREPIPVIKGVERVGWWDQDRWYDLNAFAHVLRIRALQAGAAGALA